MLLCWLLKCLLCCCNAFIYEDHYFSCAFLQDFGLRLEVKETTRRSWKPQMGFAPTAACGPLRGSPGRGCDCGAAVSSEVMNRGDRGTAPLSIEKPKRLEIGGCVPVACG